MTNSVLSQALAAVDQQAKSVLDSSYKASAYAYIPGKTFGDYAAEQIAEQIEDHFTGTGSPTPAVVAHITSVAANAADRENERSLLIPRFENNKPAGVVF